MSLRTRYYLDRRPWPASILTCAIEDGDRVVREDGILVDTHVSAQENHLETIDYEATHGISLERSEAVGARWMERVRSELGERADLDIIELGAGTGLLSLGLVIHGGFRSLLISDVSKPFLGSIRHKLETVLHGSRASKNDAICLLLASIDDMPIKPASADVVLANSVLHHIYDWRAALKSVRHMLRPGGMAIFGEPFLQGQSLEGFLARLVFELDSASAEPAFTAAEQAKLKNFSIRCTREFWAREAEKSRDTANDKHLFDEDEVRSVALDLGFTSARITSYAPIRDGLKNDLKVSLQNMSVRAEPLERYATIFKAFQDQVIAQTPTRFVTPFAHLILRT